MMKSSNSEEVTGLTLLLATIPALIDILIEKGVTTEEELKQKIAKEIGVSESELGEILKRKEGR